MEALMLALGLAVKLLPAIASTVNQIGSAIDPENPAPISVEMATNLTGILETASATIPALGSLVPMVQKAFSGEQFNDADLAVMKAAADDMDKQIDSAVAEVRARASTVDRGGVDPVS